MTAKAWLKSGLTGGAVAGLIALVLMLPVPALTCCGYPLIWLFLAGTGVLTAQSLPPNWSPRVVGGVSAAAGLVAALVSGLALVVSTVLQTIFFPDEVADLAARAIEGLPPQVASSLGDPSMLDLAVTPGSAAISGSLCCGMNLIVGVVVATVGGVVWSGLRRLYLETHAVRN
jgi:hypothetical protein